MTKLEKLKKELSRCEAEIKRFKEKEKSLEEKILLEEQKEIRKLMNVHHLSFEELSSLMESEVKGI